MPADHAGALQSILASLGILTVQQLVDLFHNYSTAPGFTSLVHTAVPEIVGQHAQAAATVTAQWYDELAPDLPFQARPVVDLPAERIAKTIDWALHAPTAPAPDATGEPSTAPTSDDVLSRLSGSTKRMVYDASRQTVVQNAAAEGVRWARQAQPDACAFCRLLATRSQDQLYSPAGVVWDPKTETYHTVVVGRGGKPRGKRALGEKYHDHCRCVAVPVRAGEIYVPPASTAQWQQDYIDARDAGNRGLKEILAHMRAANPTAADGTRSSPAPRVEPKPAETKADIAARHLPGLEKSLAELRAKGLPEDSSQIQYHLKQIAKFRAV